MKPRQVAPWGYRVYAGEFLQMRTISSIGNTLAGFGTVEYDNGSIVKITLGPIAPATDRTVVSSTAFRFPRDGTITQFCCVQPATVAKRGQLWVTVTIRHPSDDLQRQNILQAYAEGEPGPHMGEFEQSTDGHGFIRTISLGDPDANNEYAAQAVPTNALWVPRSFLGQLVSDANAANRAFRVEFEDGTQVYASAPTGAVQTASLTINYRGGRGHSNTHKDGVAPTNDTPVGFSLPAVKMEEAHEVQFVTQNRQATDNWGAGFLQVEEWINV